MRAAREGRCLSLNYYAYEEAFMDAAIGIRPSGLI